VLLRMIPFIDRISRHQASKKGQGLSLNTVVLAALALIVLIIIVLILTGKIRKTSEGIDDTGKIVDTSKCEIPGARTCVLYDECETTQLYSIPGCTAGTYCCEVPRIRR